MGKKEIPIINIESLTRPNYQNQSARDVAIEKIDSAMREYGFFYITGHGIDESLVEDLKSVSREFFALPKEIKNKIAMKKSGLAWRGFFPVGAELTSGIPDQKEGIYFGAEHSKHNPDVLKKTPLHGQNLWPEEVPQLKKLTLEYIEKLTSLGHTLMEAVGQGLKLPKDYFRKRFSSNPTTLFRVFNYPIDTNKPKEDIWGVREHTDMGFLTILRQDEPGLSVKLPDGTWIDAPPVPNSFVINIGDMLQLWTKGHYIATPHRVKNQNQQDRISLPFFFDPNWHCSLEAIPDELLQPPSETKETERWDNLSLQSLEGKITYGEFVWKKVSDVFPHLAEG